jgi:hypothetical protein
MSTSLSDLLTAAKNIVTSLSGLGQTYLNVVGQKRSAILSSTTATLVNTGQGRLSNVSVIAGSGSNVGAIYDSNSASSLTNQIATIPTVPGVYALNIPYNNGLVLVLGTGMTALVSYS